MADIGDLYTRTQARVETLVSTAEPAHGVPACPGWTVHDVIAHVVGLATDVVRGEVDGYASAQWTDAQVSARHASPMGELIEEWHGALPPLVEVMANLDASSLPETVMTAIGPAPRSSFRSAFLVDLVQHEHDLRGALAAWRSVLDDDVEVLDNQVRNLRVVFALAGLPTLEIAADDTGRTWKVGRDEPVARLRGGTVELLRSIGGRRTDDEIRTLGWSGASAGMAERLVLPFFEAPASPIAGG